MSTLIPRALLGLTVLILCSPVSANPGVDWLQSRLQADGSFQDTENTVTPFQATAEVLRAFDIAGVTMSIDTTASLQFIDNEPYNNTENLARKIIANVQAGNTSAALISQLMLHQNRDGSFGERAGYDGTVLDTAFALEALAIAGQETGEAVGYAVGFLQTAQQSDGSWRLRNNDSSLYLTAVAMRAIWHYRHRFLLDQTLVKARDYLLNQRNAAGTWGQTFETALALIAVAPLLSDTGELDNSIQALAQSQQSDGSFGGVYQTALALRALQLAEHGNPDLGQITGRIIDGETGIGLADVGIALSGSKNAVSSSDVNGDFHFSGLPAGVYNLEITLDGYGPITAETMLVNGETKDLAIIRLLKQPDNTTAVLRGTVTAATNGNPVVGASVAVSGNASASVLTDENGEFFISGLPAGPVTVSVNADGFEPSSHSIALQAGATTLINIGLNVESPPTFSVAGIVTAQDTGEVLPGATVTVSGAANASTTTANDGSYNLSGLMPGAVTISATTDGYRSASVVITAQDRQALIFSPGLVPNDSPEEHPELGGIRGTVIDGTTGAAIVGATVALTADGVTRTFTTNTSGQFQAADVPAGMATLDLTTSGYQPNNRNFEIVAGLTVDLGEIPLTPADFVPLTGATGTVVDSLSNRPIAGARIEISVGSWTFVRLDGVYTKPVVVAGPLTHNNDRSLSVRVRNVTPTSFEIAMLSPCEISGRFNGDETDCAPVEWQPETVRYLVVEAGAWQLADGTLIEAGHVSTDLVRGNGVLTGTPVTRSFTHQYTSAPAMLHTVNSDNDPTWVTSSVWGPTSQAVPPDASGFRIALEGGKFAAPHGEELIGWVAIETGSGTIDGRAYSAGMAVLGTGNSGHDNGCFPVGSFAFSHVPQVVATQVGMAGGNGSWSRLCGAGITQNAIFLHSDEDQVTTAERAHTNETVAWFAIDGAGTGNLVSPDGNEAKFEVGEKTLATSTAPQIVITNDDGEFSFEAPAETQGSLTVSADGYRTTEVPVYLQRGANPLGNIRIRPEGVEDGRPDLVAGGVAGAGSRTVDEPPRYEGSIEVTVRNAGPVIAGGPFEVHAFVDKDLDGEYGEADTELGSTVVGASIPAHEQQTVSFAIAGDAPFRDAPVSVFVDSGRRIVEANETNNVSSVASACRIEPPPAADLEFKLQWISRGLFDGHDHEAATGPLAVGQFTDDNGDGVIDSLDTPDIVAPIGSGGNDSDDTMLAVFSGDTGELIWGRHDVSISHRSSPAIGDIDGDGFYEIAVVSREGTELHLFEHDGTLAWTSPTHLPLISANDNPAHAPLVVNLDQTGLPEIVVGNTAISSAGAVLWHGSRDIGTPHSWIGWGSAPIAADIHPSPGTEVSAGRTLYAADGTVLWHRNDLATDGTTGIGDFDGDGDAEIVLVENGRIVLLEHTGETVWDVALGTTGPGGPPTVADFDGDGEPEIGVAGGTRYVVFETDGSIKWSVPNADDSSRATGSSLFDFDADGRIEVLYADEREFRIFDGTTGATLVSIPNTSVTKIEYPIVVNADNDPGAEIVLTSNPHAGRPVDGIRVFEAANGQWASTRSVWNQHSYHVTNINDDGTIPQVETPSWRAHNTYRLNRFLDRDATATADVTVSLVRLIDQGQSQPFDVAARIGNGGGVSIPAGTVVSLYDGDPSADGILLAEKALPELAAGEFTDITFTGVTPSGDALLYVVGDSANAFIECDETNNRQAVPVDGSSILGEVMAQTDLSDYPAGAIVNITSTATNTGSFTGEYRVALQIVDANGSLVAALGEHLTGTLTPGASTEITAAWPSFTTLAGPYEVQAVLTALANHEVVDQAMAGFQLRVSTGSDPIASLRTTTDRQQYHTTDTVQILDLARNLSTNALIDAARLSVTVTGPDASVVFVTTLDIGSLAPGNLRELQTPMALTAAVQGDYRVVGELRDGSGQLQATDEALFEVVENSALSLNGNVEAQLPELFIGETQVCNYTVNNAGTIDLQAQELWQVLVNVTGETEVAAQATIRGLPAGVQTTLIQSLATQGLTEGDYACVLQATINGERLSLAHDIFALQVPPINLDASLNLAERGRLLVLLDAILPQDEQHQAQRAYLEELLTNAGWSYTLVDNADAFAVELRSGGYNTYALFAEHIKLDNQVAKELREAVYRGEGLLIAGAHDNRNHHLYEAAGVKLNGKLSHTPGMQLVQNDLGVTGGLNFVGDDKPLNVTLEGATGLGDYQGGKPGPAITRYDYGDGITVLAGFDLLREAYLHEQADAANTFAGELLLAALDHVQPPIQEPVSGGLIPVRFTLQNPGIATPGRVLFTLPADARLLDADQPIQQNGNLLEWLFDLQQDQQTGITLWLQAAGEAGELVIDAQIQTGTAPDYLDHDALQRVFQIEPHATVEAVIGELQAHNGDNFIKQALHSVEKAHGWIEAGDIDKALQNLIQAADKLMQSAHPEAANLRRKVAELTRQTAQRF